MTGQLCMITKHKVGHPDLLKPAERHCQWAACLYFCRFLSVLSILYVFSLYLIYLFFVSQVIV